RYRIEALEDSPLTTVYADRAALAKDVLPSPWNDDYARIEDLHNRLGAAGEWATCLELVNQRKFAEAEPRLRAALAQEWDPAGIDLLAKVEAARGKPDEALFLLQGVNAQIGPTLHFLTRVGDLYEQTGDGERAAQAYSRAVLMAFQSGAKHRDYQHKKLAGYYERLGD